LHPGFEDHGSYGHLTGDNIGIRSGVNMACALNGEGNYLDAVNIWCARYNEGTWWVFVVARPYSSWPARGWVPLRWIDDGHPYVSACYG
jgi:hypothetical protein